MTLPWEDRMATARLWQDGYRWFRSSNVICLEKYRQLRAIGYWCNYLNAPA